MSRWGQVLGASAGVLVGAGLLYGTYLTVSPVLFPEDGRTAAPAASASPSSSASATAAEVDGCVWESLRKKQRPGYLKDEPEGLPQARRMTDATWECIDESWAVEVHSAGGDTWRPGGTAQALYLAAPDGDLLKLFDLRTDVAVTVLESDIDARLAWTARQGEGDGFQVVQVELDTGFVLDAWGDGEVPSLQRDRQGNVYDVEPFGPFDGGGTLWAGYSGSGVLQSLFVREDDAQFRAFASQRVLDTLVEEGAVDAQADPGVEVWTSKGGTTAVYLAQQLDDSGRNPGSTGAGTWVVVDLVKDEWRLAAASLPAQLCLPAPGTYVPGTYRDPGELQAVCRKGANERVYRLTVGGDPVEVDAGGP
ncbi:hypothetical protein QQX09_09160 [Demequina sp. SYSU T00192]|uniref:Uncharacterized protein n=1 Tax=Demequina litoralis TaxID=3051660 RepID=A0ABT8GA56_9MICO|nr:hypothetical protein [Demequina sp. SYSU T00192]MDN4476020.1 hypothetical protein [Demequina sp. SYSU T00192]